jgi:glycosyltransferase involved in cell wall biosynthesis
MPWWIWKLHRERPFDLIHLHLPDPMAHVSVLAVPRSVPIVVTWHSDVVRQAQLMRVYRPLQDRLLRRAARIIAPTPAHYASSSELNRLAMPEKHRVIPFGIEVERFSTPHPSAPAIRARFPGSLVFALGRHVYYKGFEYLIEAMRLLPGAHLAIGGTGPLTAALKAKATALDLTAHVHFVGRIPDAELPGWYQACDVHCMPSVEPAEAFGIVQIEAMAAGKPVVCCALGNGVNFVNLDGETGLAVPPRDVPALAAALRRLLSDSALRQRLGERGFAKVKAEFSVAALRRGTIAAYQEALSIAGT